MKSVDLVKNAIKLKRISRLPVYFKIFNETDIEDLFIMPPNDWKSEKYEPFYLSYEFDKVKKNVIREDEWGVLWRFGDTYGIVGSVFFNPLKDLKNVENYKFPDPNVKGRLRGYDKVIRENKNKYIVVTQFGLLFERLYFLHGFNETLVDLITDIKGIENLLDRILEFQLDLIRNIGNKFKGIIHGFKSTDDWGTQTNIFINPELWRKIFKPRYKEIANAIHSFNMDFWLHSDGKIDEIIPDLIEIGIDVIDLPQPKLFNLVEFGKKFSNKCCFSVYIDIQKTILKFKKEIEEEAEEIISNCSNDFGSGVIAMDYPDSRSISSGSNIINRKIALDSFKKSFLNKIQSYK